MNQYTKSGSAPTKAAARRETTNAIGFLHSAVLQQVSGFPIEMVVPCEGTGYEVGAVSVIDGPKNPEAAKACVAFVLSPEGQKLAAQVGSYQVPSNGLPPLPPEAPDLTSVKLIDYDFATFGASDTRERLLTRWNAEVIGAGGAAEQ